jgi:type II secretory pathway component GspD/PulD (secretin)
MRDYFKINQIVRLPSDFRAQIGLMESMGLLDVQSTPQIAPLNGHTANIKISTKEYILMTSELDMGNTGGQPYSKTTERLESFESNVSLSVTPWVTSNREVTVEVKPVFQIPGKSPAVGKIPPPINSREISSTVRLKDGETYVLGGLISTTVNDTRESLPVLGRIPVLGWLFSYKSKRTTKDKLMIFLTPHIYYGSEGAVNPLDVMKDDNK